jgi:phage tail sheath protein FI
MAIQTSYPGVYIEEFAPAAPIEGVGTSTAAFIGVAEKGDLDTPTKVTSWDQFRAVFGEQPVPGFYLWYAVRGFFENGGSVCFVVRASNGEYGRAALEDRVTPTANAVVNVRARQPGDPATAIDVSVVPVNLLDASTTNVFKPEGTVDSVDTTRREVTLTAAADAARFRPGDTIHISNASDNETGVVLRVSGATVRLSAALVGTYASGNSFRLADAVPGARSLRIESSVPLPAGALVGGTVLTLDPAGTPDGQIVESVQVEHLTGGAVTYRVQFRGGLRTGLSLDPVTSTPVQSEEFDVTVTQGGSVTYASLSIDSAHPRYYRTLINDDAAGRILVEPVEPPPAVALPDSLPVTQTVTLTGGKDEALVDMDDDDYIQALDTLRTVDDVNLIAVPDAITAGVQQAVITHCEQLADRFAVLDSAPGAALFGADGVEVQRQGLDSTRGYAALYYPWIRVRPVGSGDPILAPPSGHVSGVIARTDLARGVHKAPANEIVNGALGVERSMSDVDQGQLNLQGINVIRQFAAGGRPMLWGARTTATDRNWQYVNVRRLFLFLEESIQEGIRGAVFEPNNPGLWAKLKRTLTEFLTRVWRDGALFGNTAKEAFYVRIDETLNPDSTRALGRLYIEIGVRPSYPAEFIVVRIGIWHGGSEISEA